MFGRGKKKRKPAPDFDPIVGQAAASDKGLYQAWSMWVKGHGGSTRERMAEFMAMDLNQAGVAPNPNDPGSGVVPRETADALKKANKDIDDAYTSAEIAKDFGERLRDLTTEHIKQIREMAEAVSRITGDILKIESDFRSAPDFKAWSVRMDSIISQQTDITGKQDAILGKTSELIGAVNKTVERMGEVVEQIRAPIVGELQKYIDQKVGGDGMGDIRSTLTELVKANNSLIDLTKSKLGPRKEAK